MPPARATSRVRSREPDGILIYAALTLAEALSVVSRALNASATRSARDHSLRVLALTLSGAEVHRTTTASGSTRIEMVSPWSFKARPADFRGPVLALHFLIAFYMVVR